MCAACAHGEIKCGWVWMNEWEKANELTYLGASLMSANLPKSSPSFSVATVPLPWITTSTDPFSKIYHERPSSPWLNTVFVCVFTRVCFHAQIDYTSVWLRETSERARKRPSPRRWENQEKTFKKMRSKIKVQHHTHINTPTAPNAIV